MDLVYEALKETVVITTFVFVMMVFVDFLNVLTRGHLHSFIEGGNRQYPVSALLGATPGCFGAFMDVSLYIHGFLSFGALVGGMIASSGDEAFVMISLFPKEAMMLFGILFITGIFFGWLVDKIPYFKKITLNRICKEEELHKEDRKAKFSFSSIAKNLKQPSFERSLMIVILIVALLSFSSGFLGSSGWMWQRIMFVFFTISVLVLLSSATEHYLQDHIWKHIAKKHILNVAIWTFSAMIVINFLLGYLHIEDFVQDHTFSMLLLACLVGLIPASGPHLLFVLLFTQGLLPFSVLVASSIVQDGHGALPLMSFSIKDTVVLKLVKLFIGLSIGAILIVLGL